MRHILSLFLIFTLSCFAQDSSVITSITSTNLVVGEFAALDLTYRDSAPSKSPPEEIKTEGLTVRLRGNQQQYINGDRYYTYRYVVASETPGSYTIPSLILPHKGKSSQSLEVKITIHEQEVLERVRFPYRDQEIVCYSKLFPAQSSLYPGEATSLEYKIYLPNNASPQSWGLPKPKEMNNCTAWRFTAPGESGTVGSAVINGAQFRVGTYSTVLTALKPGTASFGPIETDLIVTAPSSSPQWPFRRRQIELPLPYDANELTVKNFPKTPPSDFKGAVGDFSIEATLPTKESISLNESITATVIVSGSGNLPQITAPNLEDTSTWKVIDVSRSEQGDERKSLTGTAEFNYILQPQRGADAFPRFTFSHFNPKTREFYTETTETAPLTVTVNEVAGNAVITAVDIPTAQMNDILAPLSEINLGTAPSEPSLNLPVWLWQLIPAALLLFMVLNYMKNQSKEKSLKDSEKTVRMQAFKKLENCGDQDFLKEAGTFIERWFRGDKPDELQTILEQRDNQCYQPDSSQGTSNKQRKTILETLKKFTLVVIGMSFVLPNKTEASDAFDLWLKGDYKNALENYQQQLIETPYSADLEYNIGNTYYRLNQPGVAALHYQRALALDPNHVEAQKNLEFTQKTQGSILPSTPMGIHQWTSNMDTPFFLQFAFAFLWLTILSAFALKLSRWKGGKLAALVSAVVIAPCLLVGSLYVYFTHPTRITDQTGENAILTRFSPVLTEPIKVTGKELEKKTLIKATPASPCQIIAVRGDWSYIALANDVRGWVLNNKVETISKETRDE